MDKDKITQALNDLKLQPERWKKLEELALSQLTEYQKSSYLFESFRDIQMRKIMAKYCK